MLSLLFFIASIFCILFAFPYGFLVIKMLPFSSFLVDHHASIHYKYVLVLGARAYNSTQVSRVLKERLDQAYEIFQHNPKIFLILSGTPTEVEAMTFYLQQKNVPSKNLIKDSQGVRTINSLAYAKTYAANEPTLIVTQKFHLLRSLYLAQAFNLQAKGVIVPSHNISFKNYIREYFAIIKALWEIEILCKHKKMQ